MKEIIKLTHRKTYIFLFVTILLAGSSILLLGTGQGYKITTLFFNDIYIPYVSESEEGFLIPEQTDWVDHGPIFEAGGEGEWDYLLYGGFTVSVLKKDGIFYLYYQGASGYRTSPDETVTGRAIGVATSQDGINFTKAENNPVLTWSPTGNGEEGAVSAGAALNSDGNVVIHYGANTAINASSVNADGRVAVSSDGINFSDLGIVLKHDDPAIWGSGDEIFPILSIHDNDQWFVYYLPNGILQSGRLGVAWGEDFDHLTQSSRARAGLKPVEGWGTGSAAEISPGEYVIFLNNIRKGTIQAYLMSPTDPAKLSLPVQTYRFDEVQQASIYLDKETRTWFMFYRSEGYYGVKIAPAKEIDEPTPTQPSGKYVLVSVMR
jgi:hypothetical protein